MNETLYLLLFYLIAVFFHEVGHYIVLRVYGIHPRITFKWYAVFVGENQCYDLSVFQYKWMLYAGCIVGLPFVWFNNKLLIVYVLTCSYDLLQIFLLKGNRMTLRESIIINSKKQIEELEFIDLP